MGVDVKDAADFQVRVSGIAGHHLAKAGVEMAIWDLLGKRLGRSLRDAGRRAKKVEVGSHRDQESSSRVGQNRG
ncbi:MAG: hypothetical protein IPO36_21575 [Anaerolineales bacterium]|nr:hypothetical protein [Anaerolineales bacterium]